MGNELKKTPYTKTTPRRWTKEETTLLTKLIQNKYTTKQIARKLNRSETSIAIKRKRLNKKKGQGNYNKQHYKEKQKNNKKFIQYIQPRNVLDVYAGENTQYQQYKTTSNDINIECNTDYHMDGYKFMIQEYLQGHHYDFIDLDPFGSCYDCIDIAMKLIRTEPPLERGGGNLHNFRRNGT